MSKTRMMVTQSIQKSWAFMREKKREEDSDDHDHHHRHCDDHFVIKEEEEGHRVKGNTSVRQVERE